MLIREGLNRVEPVGPTGEKEHRQVENLGVGRKVVEEEPRLTEEKPCAGARR